MQYKKWKKKSKKNIFRIYQHLLMPLMIINLVEYKKEENDLRFKVLVGEDWFSRPASSSRVDRLKIFAPFFIVGWLLKSTKDPQHSVELSI